MDDRPASDARGVRGGPGGGARWVALALLYATGLVLGIGLELVLIRLALASSWRRALA